MMDDLIDLAQAEKNEMTFQERTIYLAQFLGDVTRLAGQDCKHKGLQIYLHLDKSMPACILTDPNRLRQVLINLLRNACKYTQEGHVVLAVSATESMITQKVRLKFEIKDTGIGISQDHLNKVFEAFFQVENSKTYAEGGVGLGLSIVKDIVKKMNGKVNVSSTPNKGSVFTVEFEFSRPEKSPWFEIYKSLEPTRYTVLLLSRDQMLQRSFASLTSHINIDEIIYIEEDFARVLFYTDPNRKYWVVLDPMTATMDLDILVRAFGRNVFVLGQNKPPQVDLPVTYLGNAPFLPYEILTSSGFSSRKTQRKHLAGLLNLDKSKRTEIEDQQKEAIIKQDLNIIIADDDQGNIELYKAYFSNSPWQIDYNYDGVTAWESFEKKLPDLLILDVRMPNMDGFELLERIRGFEKRRNMKPIPVILVTADLLDYTAQTAKTFEDVTLLSKPIKKKLLMDTIQNVSTTYR
jgi:CheY-like chemotaxis protein